MNIWLINHYAVPPQYYPLIRQYNFGKYLLRLGHRVTIFAASTVHNSNINLVTDGSLYKEIDVDGIKYVVVNCKGYTGNGLKRIYNMFEFARKLPKVCKNFEKPDVIVSTSMPPMSCAKGVGIARKYGCKAIAEIADLWPESIVAYGVASSHNPAVLALRRLEKWIYTKSDAIIFTMEGAYDYIIKQRWEKAVPYSKVYFINNGVDLEQFEYNKEHYQIKDKDLKDFDIFKVVYTGSIRKVNNLGLLLDSAKLIKNPKIKFLIWGDGDELPILKKRVQVENIKNVVFKGKVEKKFVPYIVSHADLNFAHNEATPLFKYGISFNKLFDYMAAGKPIFCDFHCDYNPAVKEGCGIESVDTSSSAIASKIDYLSKLNEKDYEAYCYNALNAARKYDFKNLTNDLISVIVSK